MENTQKIKKKKYITYRLEKLHVGPKNKTYTREILSNKWPLQPIHVEKIELRVWSSQPTWVSTIKWKRERYGAKESNRAWNVLRSRENCSVAAVAGKQLYQGFLLATLHISTGTEGAMAAYVSLGLTPCDPARTREDGRPLWSCKLGGHLPLIFLSLLGGCPQIVSPGLPDSDEVWAFYTTALRIDLQNTKPLSCCLYLAPWRRGFPQLTL